MIRFLRRDQSIFREDDGAVQRDIVMEEFMKKFDGASQWCQLTIGFQQED